MEPQVSVVIPSYNRASLLKEALDSVLAQTSPVLEILVVDDGSTDETHDLVRGYGSPVQLIVQSHVGVSAARNRGMDASRGNWIAFLDSDDRWQPQKIEAQTEYLRANPQCNLVHTGYSHFDGECRPISPSPHLVQGDYKVEYFFSEYWVCTSSALIRKSDAGRFPEWTSYSEDVIFFADFLRRGGRLGYMGSRLVDYRIHKVSLTKNPMCEVWGASAQLRWIDEAYSADQLKRDQLRDVVIRCTLRQMEMIKYRRDWPRYWALREWVNEHWPEGEQRHEWLKERIYPPIAYWAKDLLDSIFQPVLRR